MTLKILIFESILIRIIIGVKFSKMRYLLFLVLAAVCIVGCSETNTSTVISDISADVQGTIVTNDSSGKIYITDFTGKRWDITLAVTKYEFEPGRFQHGGGPFAIPPLLNPQFLSPVDAGFPDNSEDFIILGANLNDQVRAYALRDLIRYEVVNDKFGSQHLAVAY
jgi:hypothetical protein